MSGTEMSYIGAVEFFDSRPFIEAANILVGADEPLRALQLLDNLPGFYRDNLPIDIHELKRKILKLLCTPTFYLTNIHDQYVRHETSHLVVETTLRGQLIEQDIAEYNKSQKVPKLLDLGPGEYWLPIGLDKRHNRFRYADVNLCPPAKAKALPYIEHLLFDPLKEDADIFVACELIEHLHKETDIRTEMEKYAPNAKFIHISTPKYTFDGRNARLNWDTGGELGHLRTYTPREFQSVVSTMFPEFRFTLYDSNILHMRGVRN